MFSCCLWIVHIPLVTLTFISACITPNINQFYFDYLPMTLKESKVILTSVI